MSPRHYFAFLLVIIICASAARAAAPLPIPAPPIIAAKSYLVIDSTSGREIAAMNADMQLAPASLTKIMTTYVVFSALQRGTISLDDEVTVSESAWRSPGSRMFIEVGSQVTVHDLLLGMIVQSGNDASVALAEHVAGTESVFAEMMNQYASRLGMHASYFRNATGLPAEGHVSSARDLAVLARAIIADFPKFYEWHAVREFTYNNIKQSNRNALLWRDDSVDGLKTGHTKAAGYCLVASAKRDDMRLISVVLGTSSKKTRTDSSQALLNYGFRFFETRLLFKAGEVISTARIWKSANEFSELGVLEDLYITIRRGSYGNLKSTLDIPAILLAPVSAGQPLAELKVSLDDEQLVTAPLRALADNPEGSFWQRTRDNVSLWFE
ncbi:MAG: D-alanyl-D-alanine carboxypeptidase [Proteobacteria bacterium]|nr:D-alanyl-D-alanine carboxypeptidase [Pseudomonadota bacterium]